MAKHIKKQRHYFASEGPSSQSYGFSGFCGDSDGKASACSVEDPGSIPGSGRSPGEGNGNPLQYSCLKNSMDRGAWRATVHGVTNSRTQLNDFTLMVFPVVMCGYESLTIKKAEHWRIDSFKSYWRRFLRVSLGCQEIKSVNPKGNQPWIFIGSTDAEAEAPILWSPDWEEWTHWKRLWCWERLKSKGEEGGRRYCG